jgi:calcineurin-like phosphoesterase family protein
MKVKILTSFPKQTYNFNNVYFSSDFHLNHKAVIDYGRKFDSVEHMNDHIIVETNKLVKEKDLLILTGDTMMGEKNYEQFLDSLVCKNVIMLYGNHCSLSKMLSVKSDKLIYQGNYLELNIEGQIICCSHFPHFCWNFQDDGSFFLHGHNHGDEPHLVKEIHKYKSMDVGIDSYHKLFGTYSVFSFSEIKEILKDKLIIGRHEN